MSSISETVKAYIYDYLDAYSMCGLTYTAAMGLIDALEPISSYTYVGPFSDLMWHVPDGNGVVYDDTYSYVLIQLGATPPATNAYLTFSSSNTKHIRLSTGTPDVDYSFDGQSWYSLGTTDVTFGASAGSIYVRGDNPAGFSTSSNYTSFVIDYTEGVHDVSCSGNVMSLINYTNPPAVIPNDHCFYRLFYNCKALNSIPSLPATTLTESCYRNMFESCTGITSVNNNLLPAMTVCKNSYRAMFYNCTGLTSAPELPAETIDDDCYNDMFNGCSSLEMPVMILPAMTLKMSCYAGMFCYCSSLRSAQISNLGNDGVTLADGCYWCMFKGCTSLVDAVPNQLAARTIAPRCYGSMFKDCSNLYSSPVIMATSLDVASCTSMYENCYKLQYVQLQSSNIDASNCIKDWLKEAGRDATGEKNLTVNGAIRENATLIAEKGYFTIY